MKGSKGKAAGRPLSRGLRRPAVEMLLVVLVVCFAAAGLVEVEGVLNSRQPRNQRGKYFGVWLVMEVRLAGKVSLQPRPRRRGQFAGVPVVRMECDRLLDKSGVRHCLSTVDKFLLETGLGNILGYTFLVSQRGARWLETNMSAWVSKTRLARKSGSEGWEQAPCHRSISSLIARNQVSHAFRARSPGDLQPPSQLPAYRADGFTSKTCHAVNIASRVT